jgi:hypothetical protein
MSTETSTPAETQEAPSLSLLASEHYGHNYHQEEKPDGVQEEAETQQVEPAEEPEEVEETPEEPEEIESTEESEEPEFQEFEISHIAQLLDVDEDSLTVNDEGKIVLNGKVNGAPVQKALKELLDNYQMYEAADQRLEEAKSKAKSATQELAEKSEAIQAQFTAAATMLGKAEKLLQQESDAVDWKTLREQDPAEYSAKRVEFEARQKELNQFRQEALEEYQKTAQAQQQEMQKQFQQHLQQEQQRLMEKLPDWKDEAKAKAEKGKLTEYLVDQGFSKDEVMGASDHRHIVLARKAMLYDEMQKGTKAAEKKVAKVPRVLKPGAPKSNDQLKSDQQNKLKSRLAQSGSIDDAFALLQSRRKKS